MLTGTVPNERENHVFHHDVLFLWNNFAVLNKKKIMLKDPMMRWLIEKKTTILEKKNLFSLLRIYEHVF